MVSLVDRAVGYFGPGPVIAFSLLVGVASYPLVKRVAIAAFQALDYLVTAFVESAFVVRLRSMNCTQCADHHREHIRIGHAEP